MARRNRSKGVRQYATPPAAVPTAAEVAAELLKQVRTPAGATVTQVPNPALASPMWGGGLASPLAPGGWVDPNVPFGPGVPLRPAPLDPLGPDGRPMPRRSEYPVSWNLPGHQGGTDRHIPWNVLRSMADGIGVIRQCITIRKAQAAALEFDFVPAESAFEAFMLGQGVTRREIARAKRAAAGDRDAREEQRDRLASTRAAWERDFRRENAEEITRLRRWWQTPDRLEGWDWDAWVSAVVEEMLVTDALSLYPHLTIGGELHSVEVIDGTCYSDDTEVLTRRGWVRFADVTADDEFATRHPKTNAFEWQAATYFHQARHDGPMYHFNSKSLDILVSPNHRMLVEALPRALGGSRHREPGDVIVTAEDLAKYGNGQKSRIPMTSVWEAAPLQEFRLPARGRGVGVSMPGNDFAAFMGMWLSEGSLGGGDQVVITQDPKSKGYEEFRALLARLFGREGRDVTHTGKSFVVGRKVLHDYLSTFGKAHEKYVPEIVKNMSADQLRIFWRFYMLGDGCYSEGRERIITVSRRMADDLQEIAQKIGYCASVAVRKAPAKDAVFSDGRVIRQENMRPAYVVSLSRTQYRTWNVDTVDYHGDIYCVSVPNEILYVRRNGRPAWCGNTIKPLRDHRGGTPQPPNPAYQQILHGFPRGEFLASTDPDGEYTRDALMYLPRERRPFSPYGLSPVERAIQDADLYMKRRNWMNSEYDDGVVPELLVTVDATMTPEQLLAYERVFNGMLSGNTAERHRAKMLPKGFDPVRMDSLESRYTPDYDLFLIRLIANHLDVSAMELGFPPSGGLGGAGFDEGDEKRTMRRATRPTAKWIASIVNQVSLRHLGMPDTLTYQALGIDDEDEDEDDTARVQSGGMTLNEYRDERGLPRYDVPEADMPLLWVGNSVVPLEGVAERALLAVTRPVLPPGAPGSPAVGGPQGPGTVPPGAGAGDDGGSAGAGRPGAGPKGPAPERQQGKAAGPPGSVSCEACHGTGEEYGPDGRQTGGECVPCDGSGYLDHLDQAAEDRPTVAGLAIRAESTGRVLMLQRALTDDDPAAGTWEVPGGHIDGAESPEDAARREWAEEVGLHVPPGDVLGSWRSGPYVGVVLSVPDEDAVPVRGQRWVSNPDDPDGDAVEAVAWWNPADLPDNPAVRAELAASLDVVLPALRAGDADKGAEAAAFRRYIRRVKSGDRRWRPFGFQAHPSVVADVANDLAGNGEYAAALAALEV